MNLDEALDRALIAVRKQAESSGTAPYHARVSAERRYGQAYQNLVRAGRKPQLRTRYRYIP
jgi:hypothetical protein